MLKALPPGPHYTYSKSIDWFNDSGGSLLFFVPSAFGRNRAVSNFDRTHNLQIAGTWELPLGKGKTWLKNSGSCVVACGWQLNALISSYTGLPFTVQASGASLNAPSNTQVADQVVPLAAIPGGIGPGHPYFDQSAFQAVTQARFGNSGRNTMREPGLTNANLSLFRVLYSSERWSAQLRLEAYNFPNTAHFMFTGALNAADAVAAAPCARCTVAGNSRPAMERISGRQRQQPTLTLWGTCSE